MPAIPASDWSIFARERTRAKSAEEERRGAAFGLRLTEKQKACHIPSLPAQLACAPSISPISSRDWPTRPLIPNSVGPLQRREPEEHIPSAECYRRRAAIQAGRLWGK
eukprot:8882603-Pyramimonas_sp.AAC.1